MHHFGGMEDGQFEREVLAAARAAAAGDASTARAQLRRAFELLTEARERFYPVECYLLDLCLLIPRVADVHFEAAIAGSQPLNILVTGADIEEIVRDKPDLREAIRRGLDAGTLDLVGGEFQERPTPLMPLPSVLREFERGAKAYDRAIDRKPTTWGRRRYGFSTFVPEFAQRQGMTSALHVALDDGIYPDEEQSRIRWEGCDGSVVDATSRIPLAAESAASYLRFPNRMAESMQQDQTAAVLWARWPEVKTDFWEDLKRIHNYAPVLGRFVTCRQFFEQSDESGRLSKFEERQYLSPFFIQAVAAEEADPISRFQRHFRRRAQFDRAALFQGFASILREQAVESEETTALEDRLEASGPDLPSENQDTQLDTDIEAFGRRGTNQLSKLLMQGAAEEPGYLILNPLAFDRTVTVELPQIEAAPVIESPIRGVQFDAARRCVTLDLPACGYQWISARGKKSESSRKPSFRMAEGAVIANEFIEVHVNEATGGIARIKQYGRKPNRLSQQLAFRFGREQSVTTGETDAAEQDRTFYSEMRCNKLETTCSGPGLGEIVTSGVLIDPGNRSTLAEYRQMIRVWRGRRIIELEMELKPLRMPEGDPWSNYFAARFAWNDSTAAITRSVLGTAHGFQWERFESPHFIEIATDSDRTTLLCQGLPFHRKTGIRMVDTLLIVAGESARHFQMGIAIDADYPMQPARDVLNPPAIIPTAMGPPVAGQSGWLFHVNAKNVQVLQILPLREPMSDDAEGFEGCGTADQTQPRAKFGFALRLVETEGRQRPVQIRCFRTPTAARQRDLRGRTITSLKIIDDAVLLEITGYEIADVEVQFDDDGAGKHDCDH
jgi:alpha-mannosidase